MIYCLYRQVIPIAACAIIIHTSLEETMSEEKTRDNLGQTGISRRQLLKALAATGGAVAASSLLPDEWSSPVVDVGTLPAHAQISATPTPLPAIITDCGMSNAAGGTEIYPTSTVERYAIIRTERPDIEEIPLIMTLEVVRVQGGSEQLTECTGTATILPANDPNEATFRCPDYDLTPHGLAPGDTLVPLWTFQNTEDSTSSCSISVPVSQPN